jgi:beta-lactamase class A
VTTLVWGSLPPASWAPENDLGQFEELADASIDSLTELQALRDRLLAEDSSSVLSSVKLGAIPFNGSPRASLHHQRLLQTLKARIFVETLADAHWANAVHLSQQALQLRQRVPRRLVHAEQTQQLWEAAIDQLQRIPPDSVLFAAATQKIADYQQQQLEDSHRQDAIRSTFLVSIAEQTGLPLHRVHITVCTVDLLECHRLNGDRPSVSAASLIKLPVAVALMQKLADEDIPPETPLYLHPDNHTEDASSLFVGGKFPLQDIMGRMIDQSSNIAINQLIDYLGLTYINAVLERGEFDGIVVVGKLVGDRIEPKRMGNGRNQITTDALAKMMADIYQQSVPGHELLMEALATQFDTRMAQAALQGEGITWMGEKTGWNSNVLGSTSLFSVDDEPYVMAVATDDSTSIRIMQDVIRAIAHHILENDGF